MAFVGIDETVHYNLGGADIRFDQCQSGDFSHPEGDGINHYDGVGGQASHNYPGVNFGGASETLLQAGTLLTAHSVRNAINALPPVIDYIQGGLINVVNQAKTQTYCYIDSVTVACEVGGLVVVTYNWVALEEAKSIIAASAAASAVAVYAWHRADVQIDTNAYQCERFEITLANNLTPVWSLDATVAPNEDRWVEEYTPGMPEVTISADFRADPGFDLTADEPVPFDFTCDCLNGASTLAITSAAGQGFYPTSDPVPLTGGGDAVTYSITGEMEHDDACTLAAGNLFDIA